MRRCHAVAWCLGRLRPEPKWQRRGRTASAARRKTYGPGVRKMAFGGLLKAPRDERRTGLAFVKWPLVASRKARPGHVSSPRYVHTHACKTPYNPGARRE
eukprot:1371178-Lingulodinium_polyedra.AAC.2